MTPDRLAAIRAQHQGQEDDCNGSDETGWCDVHFLLALVGRQAEVVEAALAWTDAPRNNDGHVRDRSITLRLVTALNNYRYPTAEARRIVEEG